MRLGRQSRKFYYSINIPMFHMREHLPREVRLCA